MIEIVAESTRKIDEVIKRKLYEQYSVSEYRVVDPELETVKVYRMTDQGCLRTAELSRETNDVLSTSLLPELQISLSHIFE
ncbi:MAG: Uma2 family endonuclease [Nitrospirae bacterium]|nr:Uma2 family endonuclease [Candidatus Manganitrophaceae bacterium]